MTLLLVVQAIDAGMRGSSWGEGEAFTVQPLVPEYQGSQTEHSETNIQETLYLCVTPLGYSLSDGSLTITVDTDAIGSLTEEDFLPLVTSYQQLQDHLPLMSHLIRQEN